MPRNRIVWSDAQKRRLIQMALAGQSDGEIADTMTVLRGAP
jgi:hypothetical protein